MSVAAKEATNCTTAQKFIPFSEANKTQERNIQCIETSSGTVNIAIPAVPKVPEAFKSKKNKAVLDRSIKFSKRVPPNYIPHRFDKIKEETF